MTFKMSNNNANEYELDNISSINGNFFSPIYVLFMILYRILLFNMFIAIISAHYFQYHRDDEEESTGKSLSTF